MMSKRALIFVSGTAGAAQAAGMLGQFAPKKEDRPFDGWTE